MNTVFDQMMSRYEIKTSDDRINATHEVMQQITLAGLYRGGFFNKAAFYGGTCLRIFHGLPRFSEDMDFTLLQKQDDFMLETYFDAIQNEFIALGREVVITKKNKTAQTNIESAFLKDNTEIYNVEFRTERTIKIKIEVDSNPSLKFSTEQKIQLLPFSFVTRCMTKPCLFAGKMHALLFRNWKTRVKGRDWYDFEWYIRNSIPLDFKHLQERTKQSHSVEGEFTTFTFLQLLKQKFETTNMERVKADIVPFIKNPQEIEIWSNDYFLQLADMIQYSDDC
ncbi:MAG: nucleotidyl transferase AbiEii/AbiGii toxin family protein [Bacteroidales bacterium]|nr:nucleotidyl transferase AbiEii/AbiGii toxin family protein [Bacteroidales bacterium]NLK80904.1 nucleotidyl transferase AbiEii/AbiGii toxin family protein [Bacteroidales bacterium]HPY81813.1 nucleotidyl transferase AbiEii/AbiGii toxin family protein [Bacteroidales bacterium]